MKNINITESEKNALKIKTHFIFATISFIINYFLNVLGGYGIVFLIYGFHHIYKAVDLLNYEKLKKRKLLPDPPDPPEVKVGSNGFDDI